MPSSTQPIPQIQLSSTQLQTLISKLNAAGLYDPNTGLVVDTQKAFPQGTDGKFFDIYTFINSIVHGNAGVSAQTQYWFSQAPTVNTGGTLSLSSAFIRNATEYGLLYNGKLSGMSQADINIALQRTSNVIGQNVVDSILLAGPTDSETGKPTGGIPAFQTMLSDDIAAAISNQIPDQFRQTLGGWGGSFYFWNELMPQTIPTSPSAQISVGQIIQNTVAGGAPIAVGIPTLNQQAVSQNNSYNEFLFDNSAAVADNVIKNILTAPATSSGIANLGYLASRILFGPLPFAKPDSSGIESAIDSAMVAIDGGIKAECPTSVKLILGEDAASTIVARFLSGNYSATFQSPSTTPPTITDSGKSVTTTYSDGSYYTLNVSNGQFNWGFGPNTGSGTVLASGTIDLTAQDVGNSTEVAAIDPSGNVSYVDDAGAGASIADSGSGKDTLVGGMGNDTFVVQPTAGVVDTIDDADGTGVGSILVGNTTLTGASGNENNSTWTAVDGTTYQFTTAASNGVLQSTGTLTVTGGALASGGQLVIDDFNLSVAENPKGPGYLGIEFTEQSTLVPESPDNPFASSGAQSNTAIIAKGDTQTLTIFASAVSETAQTVDLNLTGADPSQFGIAYNNEILIFSNGLYALTIPAGESSVTVGLTYLGNSTQAQTVQLTSTIGGDSSPTSNTLAVTFNGTPASATPTDVIIGTSITPSNYTTAFPLPLNYVTPASTLNYSFTSYIGDGSNDVMSTGNGQNFVLGGGGNDSITAGSGQDTIFADSGNSTITGGGGQDIILVQGGNSQVYAGPSVVSLSTALTNQQTATASGNQGDLLIAGDGNNTIVGGTGSDCVAVGSGNNVLVLGPGSDTVFAGVDAEVTTSNAAGSMGLTWSVTSGSNKTWNLTGLGVVGEGGALTSNYYGNSNVGGPEYGTGNDTIYGGTGNSVYQLSNGNNYLDAGGGNDEIDAGTGQNTLFGGSGNDTIHGGGGNDYIDAEAGNDFIMTDGGTSTVYGGSGNSTIYSGDGTAQWATSITTNNSNLNAGSGNTQLYGAGGNDTLVGGGGNDSLFAGAGSELIQAGSGSTSIIGGAGSDTIVAGSGHDSIVAGTGNTTITGGTGVNIIWGGAGNNVISAGDGGVGATFTQVTAGSGNTTITGGAGVDAIWGGAGNDVISTGNGGTDVNMTQVTAGTGATTITGGAGVNNIFGGAGTNVIVMGNGGDTVQASQVTAGSGNTTVTGGTGVDVIIGGSGNDLLNAGSGTSNITAGSGKSTLVSGAGTNNFSGSSGTATYQITGGGGTTTINNSAVGDTLTFGSGVTLANVTASQTVYSNYTAVTLTLNDGTSVTVNGGALSQGTFNGVTASFAQLLSSQFTINGTTYITGNQNNTGNNVFDAQNQHTELSQAKQSSAPIVDNVVLMGNADLSYTGDSNNDVISANAGSDTLIAGTANDTLVGGGASDQYVLSDAPSTTTTIDGSTTADVLSFTSDIEVGDLSVSATQNSDGSLTMKMQNDQGGTITINGAAIGSMVDQLAFSDGSTASLSELLAQNTSGALAGTSSGNVTLDGGIENMTLTGTADITATGGGQANVITSNTGSDTLVAGTGNDTLNNGGGTATYVVNASSGDVTINNSSSSDVLAFGPGISQNNLTVTPSVGNINGMQVVTITDSRGGTITIDGGGLANVSFADGTTATFDDLFQPSYTNATTTYSNINATVGGGVNELVMTGDGDVTATGGSSDETLVANAANDTLISGSGNDTLIGGGGTATYEIVAGTQTTEIEQSGILDTLAYNSSVTLADLSATAATASDGTTTVTIQNDQGGSVIVDGSANGALDQIAFADGSSASLADLLAQSTSGSTAATSAGDITLPEGILNMSLTGGVDITATSNDEDDVISANSGNDTLVAGTGNDTLKGGSGATTYEVESYSGNVVIADSGNADRLLFGAGISQSNLTTTSAIVNEVSTYTISSDLGFSVTIDAGGLSNIEFADGTSASLVQLMAPTYISGAAEYSIVTTTAADGVTSLAMTGSADVTGTANALDDLITGNSGNDILVSGSGNDTLKGGSGNTSFVLAADSGATTIYPGSASNSLTFASGVTAADLSATAATAADGSLTVTIADTQGATVTIDEYAVGLLDQLNFADGSKASLSDLLAQSTTGATALSSATGGVLPSGTLNLTLTGSADLTATGNGLANVITANSGSDMLQAGAGDTTLVGGAGIDELIGGSGNDVLQGGSGGTAQSPTILFAGSGNDTLEAGSGVDYLVGGSASNAFVFNGDGGSATLFDGSGTSNIVFGAGITVQNILVGIATGVDGDAALTITTAGGQSITINDGLNSNVASVSFADGISMNLSQLMAQAESAQGSLDGADGSEIIGSGSNQQLTGGDGNDTLIGGGKNETLSGGLGDDTYIIDDSSQVVVEAMGAGNDTVQSSVSYTLPANVEYLTLTGNADLVGTSNSAGGVLTANGGDDTLVSGSGVDTLVGGGNGNTTFVVNNSSDMVTAQPGSTGNSIESSVSYVLPAFVASLTLVGGASLSAQGNDIDDVITGNQGSDTLIAGSANDTLVSGTGIDTLIGGFASDDFVVNNAADVVMASSGAVGIDTVTSSVSYTLSQNVNALTLIGNANLTGVGNGADDVITANSGDDTLISGGGNDTLIGGGGHTTFALSQSDTSETLTDAAGGTNTLAFGASIAIGSLSTTQVGDDLLITVAGSNASYLIENYATNPGSWNFTTTDGSTTTTAASLTTLAQSSQPQSIDADVAAAQAAFLAAVRAELGANSSTSVTNSNGDITNNSYTVQTIVDSSNEFYFSGEATGTTTTSNVTNVGSVTRNVTTTTPLTTTSYQFVPVAAIAAYNAGHGIAGEQLPSGAVPVYGSSGGQNTGNSGGQGITGFEVPLGTRTTNVTTSKPETTPITVTTNSTAAQIEIMQGGSVDQSIYPSIINTVVDGGSGDNDIEGGSSYVEGPQSQQLGDFLYGGSGNDNIVGTDGKDVLIGGAGNDTMDGGAGADTYIVLAGAGQGTDLISDSGGIALDGGNQWMAAAETYSASDQALLATLPNTLDLNVVLAFKTILADNPLFNVDSLGNGAFQSELLALYGTPDEIASVGNGNNYINSAFFNQVFNSLTSEQLTELYNNLPQANNPASLQPLYDTGVLPKDTVQFGAGINLSDLTFSWGAAEGHHTLDISWGDGSGIEVAMANADDPLGFGIEQFQFSDGTVVSMANMLKLAPAEPTNFPQIMVYSQIGNQNTEAGSPFEFTIPEGVFVDSNSNATITASATMANGGVLPSWLTFDPTTDTFSGTPMNADANDLSLTVTETDDGGSTASANFNLTVTASADNVIYGTDGNDSLDAGSNTGPVTMIGGAGDDTYTVANSADVVVENPGEGSDTVLASVSYVMPENVENLTGIGSAPITLTGNDQTSIITGNTGADTLIAGSGLATLIGGSGNDTFVVDNAGDVVQALTGNNTVQTTVSYTAPANAQTLVDVGSGGITLTGNTNASTLESGTGVDTLVGGSGNDTFVVNNAADLVQEAMAGSNTIDTAVSYTAADNVSNLTGTGSDAITLTGNTLNGVITANSGNDTLVAVGDMDTLTSGSGNDTLIGSGSFDGTTYQVSTTSGVVTINKSSYSDVINFGAGITESDLSVSAATAEDGSTTVTIYDSQGSNVVINDFDLVNFDDVDILNFVDGSTASLITMLAQLTTGITAATSSTDVVLPENIRNMTLTGTGNLTATGNDGFDVITANSGNDTLIAGYGADTLVGGSGATTYSIGPNSYYATIVNSSAADELVFVGGVTQSNLTTTSAMNNGVTVVTMTDNQGTTITIQGGALNQVQFADGSTATIEELLAPSYIQGTTMYSQVGTTAAAGIVTLDLTGSGNITATANSLNDVITANNGNDTLVAGSGNDTFVGGAGANTYVVGTSSGFTTINQLHSFDTNDTLSFGAGIEAADLTVTQALAADGSTTVTIYDAKGNNVVINDYFNGDVDQIAFADGSTASLSAMLTQLNGRTTASSTAAPMLTTLAQRETLTGPSRAVKIEYKRDQVAVANNSNELIPSNQVVGTPVGDSGVQWLNGWTLSDALLTDHLSGSNTAALGGDLAYYDGLNGNLTGMNLATAVTTLSNASHGKTAQTIDSWSGISTSNNKLH